MFRQETPRNYNHVTVRGNERYSEQTYVPARKEKIRSDYPYGRPSYGRPYGQAYYSPPEYQKQWDWFSLLGFVFPFVVLMLPAGIGSMGLSFLPTFLSVNIFFLYFFFGITYALS